MRFKDLHLKKTFTIVAFLNITLENLQYSKEQSLILPSKTISEISVTIKETESNTAPSILLPAKDDILKDTLVKSALMKLHFLMPRRYSPFPDHGLSKISLISQNDLSL